ncbi:MAG: ABC transporter ATP-binding protein [Bacilli bacterium]|nr:ABC transporter ATP-binding protein [Bacilli bacterium]
MKKKSIKEFHNVFKMLKNYKLTCFLSFVCMFISSMFGILNGYIQGELLESIIASNIKMAVTFLGIYFVVFFIMDNMFLHLGTYLANKVELNLSKRLSSLVYKKVLNLPAYAFEEKTTGELINRINGDTEAFANNLEGVIDILISIFACIVIFIYIMFNSYIIGIEIIVFLILVSLVMKLFDPKMKKINESIKKTNDSYAALSTETIRGIREIKTLGIKSNIFKEATNLREALFNQEKEDIKFDGLYRIIMSSLRTLLEVVIYLTCVFEISKGRVSIGFFMAMTWYVYRYTSLIDAIVGMNKMYQKMFVSLRRINELIDNILYEDEKYGSVKLKNIKGNIKFDDVTFAYKGEDITLKHFTASFVPNKKIAIVGKSGQGKSTIFNLITRIFDVEEGSIYIDDVNIKDIDEASFRKNISIIRQEPFIFNRTILENFKIVKPNITLKEVKKYCKMAYLDKYIESLPKKYNTLLGEGGVNLSGGQKQRLAIARSLAKESKIILFDEATSALDNESQVYIKKVIDKLSIDHTVIIIAHRLSTIVDSDIIYIIDKGKLQATGSHKELLETNKVYNRLYKKEDEI